MKTLLRTLTRFWFLIPLLWLTSLGACWLLTHRFEWLRDRMVETLTIISVFYLLLIVARHYKRVRTEHNLENLIKIEVCHSQQPNCEFRDPYKLGERLKHAIALLRVNRAAGGAGAWALSELPWYLVMGTPGAGKTSLLNRSGLSASITSAHEDHENSARHCDWYFSTDAVMLDTTSQYPDDATPASDFSAFLQRLKKQRKKAAINGLVLVVGLPELLAATPEQRAQMAQQWVSRMAQTTLILGVNLPIYLLLNKVDQLPGFNEAFNNLDIQQRQQPLGMTFGLSEIGTQGLTATLNRKLADLNLGVRRHVDAQMIDKCPDTNSVLHGLPGCLASVSAALEQFLKPFVQPPHAGDALLLRGLYFTSAQQSEPPRSSQYHDDIATSYGLAPANAHPPAADDTRANAGDRSYFITETFHRIIFADRDLAKYQTFTARNTSLRLCSVAASVVLGLTLIGWQALAFQTNRSWIMGLQTRIDDLNSASDRASRLTAGEGLEWLGSEMALIEHYRQNRVPLPLGAGLYQGQKIFTAIRPAYLQQLQSRLLKPVTLELQRQLQAFNASAGWAPDEQRAASTIATYNALKLYLMLTKPGIHTDPVFIKANLPTAWTAATRAVPVTDGVIDRTVSMYLQLLAEGQAPVLTPDEHLIERTRKHLKSFSVSSSRVQREYLRVQLESSLRFPPVTLDDLVPKPGRDLLFGSETLPAMFTVKGWEAFVKPELMTLLSKHLDEESDWVIDSEGSNRAIQKQHFVREFMSRYKQDYVQAWETLIKGVGVRHFADLATATARLSALSDMQNSPIKHLLTSINENTQWDAPRPYSAQKTDTHVKGLQWVDVTSSSDDPNGASLVAALPALDDGSLAKHFEPIAQLFAVQNPEGSDSTTLDRYLTALRSLKVRLSNIHRSQQVGRSSKQLISETLAGQPSEVIAVRNYVETAIDTSQGELSAPLHGLFTVPIQFAWDALQQPARQQIADAWTRQVASPWQRIMAHRYPVAAQSDNEASVKDLLRFIDLASGWVPNFERNEIGNLMEGEGLAMASSAQTRSLIDPGIVKNLDKVRSLGEVIASLSDQENGFEIKLEPSANYTDILFTLDGQVQHYRNGKTRWSRFTWPGSNTAPGARLDVITLSGTRKTVFDYPGRWGLLRMNDSARVEEVDGIQQRFSWDTGNGLVHLLVRNYGGVKLTDLANVKSLNLNTPAAKAVVGGVQ